MKIVPSDKQDFEACEFLALATNEEIEPYVSELLEWLQDLNWPVAPLVQKRLCCMGLSLVEPTKRVLKGTEDVWKFWIISTLLPATGIKVVNAMRTELQRIAICPTKGEKEEEVDTAAQQLLASLKDGV